MVGHASTALGQVAHQQPVQVVQRQHQRGTVGIRAGRAVFTMIGLRRMDRARRQRCGHHHIAGRLHAVRLQMSHQRAIEPAEFLPQ